ncbi:BnaC06g13330D [Brassica napus]|uniref:BnaC06g13330D protein n=1 Tax=Brassica napus TaxID=3708 RepID=A0A078FBF1_BRANA|nr:BnaC06g13330D [Brassica napus]
MILIKWKHQTLEEATWEFLFDLKHRFPEFEPCGQGAGSTKNGRDSPGQRLVVKIYGDQVFKPGAIIVRQRGTKVNPRTQKYHTIFSLKYGLVKFEKFGPDRKKISVIKEGEANYTCTLPTPQFVFAFVAIDDEETNPDC